MRKDDLSEGPLNTIGTNLKSAASRAINRKLGNFGQASTRLSLRQTADQNMKGWLSWLTTQRYGGEQIEGNAEDLQHYIQQHFGDQVLQKVQPTIDRVAPKTPDPNSGPSPIPPRPAATQTGGFGDAGANTRPPPGGLPETPSWRNRMRNQGQGPLGQQQPPPKPRFGESIEFRGKLIEVAMQRSAVDQVMRQLAVIQASQGQPQPQAQPQPQPQPQPQEQPQPQPQPQAQPQGQPQPAAKSADLSQLLAAPITMEAIQYAVANAPMAPQDANNVRRLLQSGQPMTLNDLLQGLGQVQAKSLIPLLYASQS